MATGIDETFLDRTADPCSDFYQFACGTWLAEHPVPAGYVQSRFFESDLRNDIFYEKMVADPPSTADPDLAKAQQFRTSCMATRSGSSIDAAPLAAELRALTALATPTDLAGALAGLHEAGVSALFSAQPDIDPGQPSRRVMALYDAGWSLPTKERYGDAPDGLESAYEGHMTSLVNLAISAVASTPDVTAFLRAFDAKSVFQFEKAVAQASLDRSAFDPVATYNPVDLATLISMVPAFDWSTYFAAVGVGTVSSVDVGEPMFFASLQSLLSSTPIAVVGQYLAWRLLEAQASAVGKSLITEEFHFHNSVLYGQMESNSDSFICLTVTRNQFGFALAKTFVDRFVPKDTKQRAGDLVRQIETAMRANLSTAPWLDDGTRAEALAKLDALLPKVAYPDRWPTYDALTLPSSSSYLDNWIAVRRYYRKLALDQLEQPVDRGVFFASPDTTNAFYNAQRNDITIPVAILDVPFFDPQNSPALSLGAIGSIVGHEITHAFDNHGRHFDGAGQLTDWWTPDVEAAFGTRAQCLVDQYDAYEPVPGIHIDGALTLGENIADLGGLKVAYAAHKTAGGDHLTSAFDADQQFFLSYAQLGCANQSPEYLGVLLRTDPHSPAKYRVNGVVRNTPAFAEAFHCPSGAPLAPPAAERCEVW